MARRAETLAEYCVRTYGYLDAVAMDQRPPWAAKPPP
jgi:hypothetical protein